VALGAVLAAAGCGYALVGRGSVLPEHVRRLVVVPFENRTQRPEVEQRVTEQVTRELASRGRYEVIADASAADAMLVGAITDYRTAPVQFDAELRASIVEVTVRLEATLRDLTTDEVLWSQSGFIFRGQYKVPEDQLFSDQETLALDQIAREAAGALVSSILEGF
jgi:hypothetical protein